MVINRTWLLLFLLTSSLSVMADSQADAAGDIPAYLPQFEFRFEQKQWRQDANNRELLTPDFSSVVFTIARPHTPPIVWRLIGCIFAL